MADDVNDLLFAPPPAPQGSSGAWQHIKDFVGAIPSAGNAALSETLGLIAPDPKLPGPLGYIPFAGTAESLLGMGGMVGRNAVRVANAATGSNIPNPPQFLDDAGQRFEENRAAIKEGIDKYTGGILPQPDLSTTSGQWSDIVGSSVGAGVGIAPSGVLKLAPYGLKTAASFLVPTAKYTPRNVPITTAVGTAQGALDMAATPGTDLNTALFGTPTPPNPTATATPPATSTAVAQIKQQTQPQPSGDINSTLFGTTALAPTFTQQGTTETPVWAAVGGLVLALGAVAAGRYTHGLGAGISDAERSARFNDPAYAAQAQAYQNEVIARGPGGSLAPPGGVSTPAPVPQGNVVRKTTTYLADKLGNDAAKQQDIITLMTDDPTVAQHLSSMVGNMHDTQLQQNKVMNFLETGYDKATNKTIPSVQGMLDKFAGLTEPQKLTLGEGLFAADEVNTRDRNEKVWRDAHPGEEPSLEDVAHNAFGHGKQDLLDKIAAMEADPVLADMRTHYKGIAAGVPEIGAHPTYGFFTDGDLAKLTKERPDYVPEMDINDRPMHPFGQRDTSMLTGKAQMTSHPVTDLAKHVEQLYPLFDVNMRRQELRDFFLDVQAKNPNAAPLMTEITAPAGGHESYYPATGMDTEGERLRDPIAIVRTKDGVKYLRVDQPDIFGAMTSNSLAAMRVRMDGMNKVRRIYQQGTTGMLSTLTGRSMGLRNLIFAGMAAPGNLPRNMYAGVLDRAFQRATGRTSSIVRGLDMPLNPVLAAASYPLGVFDRRIGQFSRMMHADSPNIVNRTLRGLIGDAPVDAMSQAADHWHKSSTTDWIKGMGTSGQGSPMHLENPGVVTGARGGPFGGAEGIRLMSARLSPRAFFSGQWMGAKPFVLNLQHATAEALSNINDASHDFIMRLNKNNPNVDPETLVYEVRNMVGNPVRTGSSRALQGISSVLPYTNVSVQGIGRILRAIGEHPVGTPLTLATGLGSMALLSLLTHMQSAAHMDFLQNRLSLQQREANIALALNGDPDKPTMIPIPQELRAAYAFMLDVMSKAINFIGARHDQTTFNGVWEGIKDFLGSHITTSNAKAMLHGGIDAGDFINTPPLLGRIDWNTVAQNGIGNLPSAFHGVWQGATSKQLLGQVADTALDSKSGQVFQNILANTIGMVSHVLDIGNNADRYYHHGHPFWQSLGMAGRDWLQTSRESNLSVNNMLFETPIRLSVQPPIAEALQSTLFAIKNLPPIPTVATGLTGGPNVARLPVPTSVDKPVANDPLISQMLQSAHAYTTRINAAMAPINAIKTQMQAVVKEGMDPQARREWLNKQTRNMADRYKLVDATADDMNYTLSRLAGKNIRVQDIDWKRGREQFQ